MSKDVILTGIRANNDLHIGNYFGALLPMIDMATRHSDKYQVNLFVPDLHSFTTPIDHSKLQGQIIHNLRLFAAAGLPLDNPDIFVYRQSYVPAHSELTWILDCFTGVGEMQRMTQFKDKSAKLSKDNNSNEGETSGDRISVGLFNYPVLMACDILLYGAVYVPVGDDQTQHLEYTRDIAERLNAKFIDVFPDGLFKLPHPVGKQHEFFGNDQGLRIRDLQNPSKKMSKSDESARGIIFLGDNPEEAAKKIISAETDSIGSIHLDWENQAGITNLLQILSLLKQSELGKVASEWEGKNSYGDLKKAVASEVKDFLQHFQTKLAEISNQSILSKLESDEKLINEVANATLLKAQQAVGLRPRL